MVIDLGVVLLLTKDHSALTTVLDNILKQQQQQKEGQLLVMGNPVWRPSV